MLRQISSCTALVLCTALIAAPAAAIDGEILITQAKAIQGGVTPGDAPGFPITLTQPGSYKFGSNITPPQGQDGIEIKEADITVDLNGFRLHGLGVARYGIQAGFYPTGHPSLTVRNGTIAGFRYWGIHGHGHLLVVENMRVTNNENGVQAGDAFRIIDSTITLNRYYGISCGRNCHVESNPVSYNGVGITPYSGTILSNTIAVNRSEGIWIPGSGRESFVGIGNNSLYGNSWEPGSSGFQIDWWLRRPEPMHPINCAFPCMF